MKVLWLASWYPNKLNPFNGDFVRRHAQAVAPFIPITVIYVVKDENGIYTNNVKVDEYNEDGLHELIVYYRSPPFKIKIFGKIFSFLKYRKVFKQVVSGHIKEKGLPDVCHVHVPMQAGMISNWLKNKFRVPYVVTEHWCGYNHLNPDNFFSRNPVFQKGTKRIFENADIVTTVCVANQEELTDLFQIKHSVVVSNVADINHFFYSPSEVTSAFTFIHVSTLTYQKNIEGILEACAGLVNKTGLWKLIIVGPYTKKQVELSKQLKLDRFIEWTGELSYVEVADHVRKASAMVMFSRFENQPCAIIEGLVSGLPVVASKVGGIPEIINEKNGILVEPGNVAGLVNAMEKMKNEHQSYDRFGIAEDAKNKFSYEVVGEIFLKLYKQLKNN